MSKVHIVVILDRSGSMATIRNDIIGGFNEFIRQQRETEEDITLSLIQFDTMQPYEKLYEAVNIKDVKNLTTEVYQPRGGTPLYDAVGRGIFDLHNQINKINPEKVMFVIVTDGQENSSREYTYSSIKNLLETTQKECGWEFIYLSSDIGAVNQAMSIGISHSHTLAYDHNNRGVTNAFTAVTNTVSNYARTGEAYFLESDREIQANESNR